MYEETYIPKLVSLVGSSDTVLCEARHFRKYLLQDDPQNDDAHIHNFCEIYVHVAGDASFLVEKSLYPLSKGDMIITKPNEIHHLVYRDGLYEHYCIWISASGNFGNFLSQITNRRSGEKNLMSLSENDKSKLFEYLNSFCVPEGADISSTPESLSAFFGFLSLLEKQNMSTKTSEKLPEIMRNILEYIDKHYTDSCKVEDIANEFFISRSTLCDMFKKNLNLTPSKYIDAKRFSHAKKLLEKGESVQKVCDACGFSDCSYFVSAFKRRFGITPHHYSKENKI